MLVPSLTETKHIYFLTFCLGFEPTGASNQSKARFNTLQCNVGQCTTVQLDTTQQNPTKSNRTKHNTTQHNPFTTSPRHLELIYCVRHFGSRQTFEPTTRNGLRRSAGVLPVRGRWTTVYRTPRT